MKRLRNQYTGIDQGDVNLFSDFENGGDMWTGSGPRERAKRVRFSMPYKTLPNVQLSLSLWDVDHATNMRSDLIAEEISRESFKLVFRTWGDTRFARVRVNWMAIGELAHSDDWDLY